MDVEKGKLGLIIMLFHIAFYLRYKHDKHNEHE